MDERSIFLEALEQPAAERVAWIRDACGTDEELRARIEALLRRHEQANSFLERPAPELDATFVGRERGEDDAPASPPVVPASNSVLHALGQTIDVPRVSLRQSNQGGAEPVERPASPEVPRRQADDRYELHGEIARGGMGAIIKGRDTGLGRDLAIKVLLDEHKARPEVVQRFVEEAQIGGQLQHPGIAPVYELGVFDDRRPFFSMKLVKGQTLSALLAERENANVDRGRFLGIFKQICETVAYAHSRGVIHRDLKPANVMVGAFGEVQVMDWGLAKVLPVGGVADEKRSRDKSQGQSIIQTLRSGVGSDTPSTVGSLGSQTQMGSVMGTPAYMPPEQALGEIDNLDERADVFGLGAILCEILTGVPPYIGDDGTQIFRLASRGKLDACFDRLDRSESDGELIALAKHCLELEPSDRPRDAGAVAERVVLFLESVEMKLREAELERAAAAARAEEERKRRRVSLALAATVVLMLSLAGGGWVYIERQEADRQAEIAATQTEHAKEMQQQRQVAVDARELAEEATAVAVQAKADLENELYYSDMEQVRLAYQDGAADRMNELLFRYVPLAGEPDYRGWEWYFWWRVSRLHHDFPWDGGPLHGLLMDPKRRWAAVRAWENRIVILDAKTGEILHDFPDAEFGGQRTELAVSTDGQWLASLSPNRRISLWRVADWKPMPPLQFDRRQVAVAFSPNGQLAAADRSGRVTFWDPSTQTEAAPSLETEQSLGYLAFSPDGSRLAAANYPKSEPAASATGEFVVWDLASRETTAKVTRRLELTCLAWRAVDGDRSVLAAGSMDGTVRLWDADLKMLDRLDAGGPVLAVAFSPNGERLAASTNGNNAIQIWETHSARRLATIKGHARKVPGVGFLDDGNSVLSVSEDSTIKRWEVSDSAAYTAFRGPREEYRRLVFGADNRSLWHYRGDVKRWDSDTGEALAGVSATDIVLPAFSESGEFLAMLTRDNDENALEIFRLEEADPVSAHKPDLPEELKQVRADRLAVSDNGAVVAMTYRDQAFHFNVVTGAFQTWKIRADWRTVADLAISPDGSRLVVPAFFQMELWNCTRNPPETGDPIPDQGPIYNVKFSPSGELFAAALWNNDIRLHDSATGKVRHAFRAHAGSVWGIDFSHDGKLLASGGFDGTVRLWDLDRETPRLTLTLPSHNSEVRSVTFAPDGRLASLSINGDARIWRIAKRSEVDSASADIDLLQRRADSFAALHRWDAAARDYLAILDLQSKRSPTWKSDANWKSDRSRFLRRVTYGAALFEALQRRLPDAPELWLARARSLALRAEWDAAAEAFAQYSEIPAANSEVWFEIAAAKRIVGDDAGYRDWLERMEGEAKENPSPFEAFVLARTVGLAPQPNAGKLQQAVAWGERGVSDRSRGWLLHALGLVQFRRGDFKAARATVQESLETGWSPPINNITLALLYSADGEPERAEQLLEQSRAWRDEQIRAATEEGVRVQVIDWLAFNALLREAERVIYGGRER